MKFIDLRSDTVTQPTQAMREAMFEAEVGDDVYGDDPTVKALEKYAAEIIGKEAALFVPSGTFGNQLALFTHCKRGDEVILGEDCHIIAHEVGAAAVISGVNLRTIPSNKGELCPKEVETRIRQVEDIHYPHTGLIALENAHSNGRVISLENMKANFELAKKHNIPVHLDGARIFNASTYLQVDPKELTKYCDSIMFAMSKGLCAPIGSILAGSEEFIVKSRKGRKLLGGGMRQAGFLAAAGLVALKEMRGRLIEDHKNALLLGEEMAKIPGIEVFSDDIQINMVFFDISQTGIDASSVVDKFYEKGIKINPPEGGVMRFVTNYWVTTEDVNYVIDTFKHIELLSSL